MCIRDRENPIEVEESPTAGATEPDGERNHQSPLPTTPEFQGPDRCPSDSWDEKGQSPYVSDIECDNADLEEPDSKRSRKDEATDR
eukprot:8127443-Pyramimonas_sp.AAC.1